MKPLVVVNPASGGGATGRTIGALRTTIERSLGEVEVAMTERPGHAIELARQGAIAGHPLVIAVGLMQARSGKDRAEGAKAEATQLGIVGQGTGGDFRKTIGLEHRIDRYVEAIASGRQRRIDIGKFTGGGKTGHWFVNILSVGMGGLVDTYVATAPRALGGKAAYFGATVRALLNARLGHVRCTVTNDGKTEEHLVRSFMIAICNGRLFGGGMNVAPMAEVDDGVFELVALGATTKLGFALTSTAIYKGDHMKQPGTVHLRGQKLKLELVNAAAQDVYLLDVDGEPMGGLPLEIEVVPKAIVLRA